MGVKVINELTKEQTEKLSEYKDKWLAIGLDTKRANRSVAEQAAKDAYKEAGLDEPKIFIWVDSPMGGLIAAKLMKEVSKKHKTFEMEKADQVRDQVWAQVRDQVWDQVRDQVWAQVWDQVRDQVGDQVWAQVWAQVGAQVRDQVWAQVRDQVGAQVRDQVGDQVWDQVWDQVRDQVGAQVRDQVGAQVRAQVWATSLQEEWNDVNFWGSQDAGWLSFYNYLLEVCSLEVCKRLKPLMILSGEVGWTWFYKNCVIFTEKPIEIHRNDQHRLHNYNAPALLYADGYSVNAIHGIRVPEYIIKTSKNEFTKEMVLNEQNADYRRCIVQKIGIEKTIELLGAEIIDSYTSTVGGEYQLLSIDFDGRGNKRPYLKMKSKSIDAYHIEGVKPEVTTVKEAIMFRNGLSTFEEPLALT